MHLKNQILIGLLLAGSASGLAGTELNVLEFDFVRPACSEITAEEKGPGWWIGRVHPDSDFRIVGERRIEWVGEGWNEFHNLTQHYDPETRSVRRGGDPTKGATRIELLEPRLLKFHVPEDTLKLVAQGRVFQFRNTKRSQCGMWFNRSRNVRVEDVAIRSMWGFGILSQFTENIAFNRLVVEPAPGSGRTCVSAADILHFSGCRGTVNILDSVLSASHDDAVNVHGTHLRIVGQPAEDKVRLRFMHHQTWGFQAFVPGDAIELVDRRTLLPYAEATVVAVVVDSPREQTLTLARPVHVREPGSDAVENVTWTPSVHMDGCRVSQIPTRGFLIATRRPVVVENTRFERTGKSAILVEDDASGWYESGPVHDLELKNNVFEHCASPVVKINPHVDGADEPVHRNIRLLGNLFQIGEKTLIFSAHHADGIVIRGNRVEVPGSHHDMGAFVQVRGARHLDVTGNTLGE